MHTPQHNPEGYANSSVHDMEALSQNVRFLVMHGIADDNVHLQSSLVLLDKLNLASVENYDAHLFPDSDHTIKFHNAHAMVYGRKSLPFLKEDRVFYCVAAMLINERNRTVELARKRLQRRMASCFKPCSE